MTYWICSCGEQFIDSRAAFLHRDGSSLHHVTPMRAEVIELEPMPTVAEVNQTVNEILRAPMPDAEYIRRLLLKGRVASFESWVDAGEGEA